MRERIHNEATGPVSAVVQVGGVAGSVYVHANEQVQVVPSQLPAGTGLFTGRVAALAWMDDWHVRERVPPAVISGAAGVGKTALVVHWARSCEEAFPDGRLYVDLQGYGPGLPLDPAEVLGAFLRDLGVPDREVPGPLYERAGRFRSLLAGRRIMIILDNALNEDQVRPLLPGIDSCPVVITGRDALAGLALHDGAELLDLELLDAEQSSALLRGVLGDRVDHERAAADLVALCGGLPLALRIVGQLARSRPGVPLAALAVELRDERDRLDVLEIGGDTRSAIRPVLSWSYHRLPEDLARAFRMFGLHPGPGIDAPAFAALCGLSIARAARSLRALTSAHLLIELSPDRYSAHDLLRLYAAELSAQGDAAEADAARTRLFDHYLHTAEHADRLVTPHRYRIPLEGSADGATRFADYESALNWLHAHWRDAVALCQLDVPELDARRWQLAYTLRGYFFLTKQWDGWIAGYEPALAACLRSGDRHAEARMRNDLGRALLECGRAAEGGAHYATAQRLFHEVGDRHGWSNAVANRAVLLRRSGDVAGALRLNAIALDYYLEVGARRNTGIAWRSRAKMHVEQDALDEAAADLDRAMEVFTRLGSQIDLAEAHNLGGVIAARRGEIQRAEQEHLAALGASRACGSRYEEAEALRLSGQLAADRGLVGLAGERWEAALMLYRSMASAKTDEISAKMQSLGRRSGHPTQHR